MPVASPADGATPAAGAQEPGSPGPEYFGKALLTFRDKDGLKWMAGALVAPLRCEGLEGELEFTKENAEARGLAATGLTLVYDDGA